MMSDSTAEIPRSDQWEIEWEGREVEICWNEASDSRADLTTKLVVEPSEYSGYEVSAASLQGLECRVYTPSAKHMAEASPLLALNFPSREGLSDLLARDPKGTEHVGHLALMDTPSSKASITSEPSPTVPTMGELQDHACNLEVLYEGRPQPGAPRLRGEIWGNVSGGDARNSWNEGGLQPVTSSTGVQVQDDVVNTHALSKGGPQPSAPSNGREVQDDVGNKYASVGGGLHSGTTSDEGEVQGDVGNEDAPNGGGPHPGPTRNGEEVTAECIANIGQAPAQTVSSGEGANCVAELIAAGAPSAESAAELPAVHSPCEGRSADMSAGEQTEHVAEMQAEASSEAEEVPEAAETAAEATGRAAEALAEVAMEVEEPPVASEVPEATVPVAEAPAEVAGAAAEAPDAAETTAEALAEAAMEVDAAPAHAEAPEATMPAAEAPAEVAGAAAAELLDAAETAAEALAEAVMEVDEAPVYAEAPDAAQTAAEAPVEAAVEGLEPETAAPAEVAAEAPAKVAEAAAEAAEVLAEAFAEVAQGEEVAQATEMAADAAEAAAEVPVEVAQAVKEVVELALPASLEVALPVQPDLAASSDSVDSAATTVVHELDADVPIFVADDGECGNATLSSAKLTAESLLPEVHDVPDDCSTQPADASASLSDVGSTVSGPCTKASQSPHNPVVNLEVRNVERDAIAQVRIRAKKPLQRLMEASVKALGLGDIGELAFIAADGRHIQGDDTADSLGLCNRATIEVRSAHSHSIAPACKDLVMSAVDSESTQTAIVQNERTFKCVVPYMLFGKRLVYRAFAQCDRKRVFIGSFATEDEANEAVMKAESEIVTGTWSGPALKRPQKRTFSERDASKGKSSTDMTWEKYRDSRMTLLRAQLEERWASLAQDDRALDLLDYRYGRCASTALPAAASGRLRKEIDALIAERECALEADGANSSVDAPADAATSSGSGAHPQAVTDDGEPLADTPLTSTLIARLALDTACMPSPLLIFLELCRVSGPLSEAEVQQTLVRWSTLDTMHRKALWSMIAHRAHLQDQAITTMLSQHRGALEGGNIPEGIMEQHPSERVSGPSHRGFAAFLKEHFRDGGSEWKSLPTAPGTASPQKLIEAQRHFFDLKDEELSEWLQEASWPWQPAQHAVSA